jgi:hypothetical protein
MRGGELAFLQAELGPDAECAAIRLLADERQPPWVEVGGDSLEPVGGAGEVGAAQVT